MKTSSPIIIFDYSKIILQKSKKDCQLDGVNNFIINSFNANFNFRFRNEPYMEKSFEEGKKESIAGHMWGASVLWLGLKYRCPNLAKLVNSEKVLEIILCHDLGEIIRGDTPIYEQYLNGDSDNKKIEKEDLHEILKDFPLPAQKKLLGYFDLFEDVTKTKDLEILVARLMDSLHGSFFVFAHGNNLKEMADLRNTLTKKHFGGVVGRLFKILGERGKEEAKEEIKLILEDHISLWKKIGVEIKHESYFS